LSSAFDAGLLPKIYDLLGRAATEDELNKLKSDYIRLSHSTAKKLLEFWCEHQTLQKP
jgi:hypothetical protein